MARALSLTLISLVLMGVWLDSYTFHYDASDLVVHGPWWQTLLGVVDVALLAAALTMAWRRRYGRAFGLLAAETVWAIVSVVILMQRDGMARFLHGFGAQSYLPAYLVVMAARPVGMAALWWADRQAGRGRTHRVHSAR